MKSWPAMVFTATIMHLATADAQSWPTRPLHAVVPFGAGSSSDIVPRVVFEQLSNQLGQSIVVENRGGAGGVLGTAAAAKAEPDGYTILSTSTAMTVAPALYQSIPYDTVEDFTPIGVIGSVPNVLIIAPSKGLKTIHEFVAAAKAKPGTFNFATVGVGSSVYMSAELFRVAAGYEAVHIPYKGGPEALTDVISGRVDYYFCPLSTALPHIREGRLLALVTSNPTRSPELPDVPTTLEAGFPNSDYTPWTALFVPAKTPKAIVDRLSRELETALQAPAIKAKYATLGVLPVETTLPEFRDRIKTELRTYGAFLKAAGLKPN